LEAEDHYFKLYASVFPKMKPDEIKRKLRKLSNIFSDKQEGDIIKDRQKLKNLLKETPL
jgi:hypothetical protein